MRHSLAHHFMRQNNLVTRLLRLYEAHGSLVVAVDFDNTLFDFHYEREKHSRPRHDYSEIYELLRRLKAIGCFIVIWTANEDERFIQRFLSKERIPYDAINENPPFFKGQSRKIYYNVLLDDAAGLRETCILLCRFLDHVSTINQKE
jgi:hypothetical protein